MENQGHGERIELKRTIGLSSACAMILGTIIGSGIFISPKGVLMEVGSVGMSLIVWAACGLLALMGALSFAELGTMIPKSGGPYVYMQVAFGDLCGFLYMWGMIVICVPTGNAIIALTFAYYILQPLFPDCEVPHGAVLLLAALAIATLTFINGLSVKWASRVQTIFSIIKILTLISIIVTGIAVGSLEGTSESFSNAFEGSNTAPGAIALAFYSGMFSYDGWDSNNFLMEELKNPYRNLPLAILISVPLVTVIYVAANAAYFVVLTPQAVVNSQAVAVTFAMQTFGVMSWIMPVLVALSTFGSLNGVIMCIGRVFYAGAKQGHLPGAIALIHIKRFTPLPAVSVLGVLSIIMLFAGDVYTLINYSTFVDVLASFLLITGLLYLRWKKPQEKRPIKVPLIIPIIFFLVCLFLLTSTLVTSPVETGMALVMLLAGIPVYIIGVAANKPAFITKRVNTITLVVQKMTLAVLEENEEE